jgi:cyclohexadienyl dehydratase
MRKRFGLPVLSLALALVLLCGPTARITQAQEKSHLTSILEANTLRVGTTGDFNPMSIRDPATNSFKGFEIKAIAFTLPYLEAGTTPIFDQKNAAKFKSWDDINQPGVTVAVILGTVFEDQAKLLLPKATLKSVQPPATSWQEVLAGRADVAITSSIDAQSIVARFPALTHLPGDQDKAKRPFGYIVAQGDFVWTNYLNNWITLKLSEGYFQSLKTKWFNN